MRKFEFNCIPLLICFRDFFIEIKLISVHGARVMIKIVFEFFQDIHAKENELKVF